MTPQSNRCELLFPARMYMSTRCVANANMHPGCNSPACPHSAHWHHVGLRRLRCRGPHRITRILSPEFCQQLLCCSYTLSFIIFKILFFVTCRQAKFRGIVVRQSGTYSTQRAPKKDASFTERGMERFIVSPSPSYYILTLEYYILYS